MCLNLTSIIFQIIGIGPKNNFELSVHDTSKIVTEKLEDSRKTHSIVVEDNCDKGSPKGAHIKTSDRPQELMKLLHLELRLL